MQLDYLPLTAAVTSAVRAEMARQRVSQAALARELGCSQQRISRRLSANPTYGFTTDEVDRIARFLGVPVSRLISRPASKSAA